MLSAKQTRLLVGIVVIASLAASTIYIVKFAQGYAIAADNIQTARDDLHLEILRSRAADGTPLKALVVATKETWERTDRAAPVVVVCHGMSASLYQNSGVQYTLAKAGYVTISPEFRGHTSNPAPTTLGSLEPWDILTLCNALEKSAQCVNGSKGAIYGESMGGLYATLAYIFDSPAQGGRGRFQALVSLSGPLNVSREIDFITNKPSALGDLPFTGNLTAKNPVTYVNETSLSNVLLFHGTADGTVDYQCSVDFVDKLDPLERTNPAASRPDVQFISVEGADHGLPSKYTRTAIAWIDQKVFDLDTQAEDVTLLNAPYSASPATDVQEDLLIAAILLVLVFAGVTYLAKPVWFTPKPLDANTRETKTIERLWAGPKWLEDHRLVKISSLFIGLQFLAGVVMYFIPGYIVNELAVCAGVTVIIAVLVLKWTKPDGFSLSIRAINPKGAVVWVLAITGGLLVYFLLPAVPSLEDSTLAVGPRITWWVPFLTSVLTILLLGIIFIVRSILPADASRFQLRTRFLESGLVGLLFGVSTLLFLFWNWDAVLYAPFLNDLRFAVVPLVALVFGIGFFVFDLIVQVTEPLTKSSVPAAVACGLVVAIVVGASGLIFFY